MTSDSFEINEKIPLYINLWPELTDYSDIGMCLRQLTNEKTGDSH